MGFWRDISPKRAANDFARVWKSENPYRWRVLAVSIALTAAVMIVALPKTEWAEPRRPTITYITSYAPDRTDQEIMAGNIEAQKRKEELEALTAQRDELRRDMYRQLGQATGLDTDAMERQIAADEAAAKAERDKKLEAFAGGKADKTDQ